MRKLTPVVALLALAATACGSSSDEPSQESTSSAAAKPLAGVKIEVAAKWTGEEQANFEQVLKAFEEKTGATVTYASTGEDTAAYLGPRIEAGTPPDVAILPQPGLVQQYADQNALKPLSQEVLAQIDQNYTPYWKELGSANGQVYGVLVKAAHKSLIWYRQQAFDDAGVQPAATWDELIGTTAQTLADSGTPPFALCGASGWTLTDLFENIYLSTAGPENYDKLSRHEIPWTDPTVTEALEKMAQIFGKQEFMLGGSSGALQTDFPTCVTQVFGQKKAAMVIEADFVAASATESGAKIGEDAKIMPFPKVGDTQPVVLGGDIAVALKDTPGAMALLEFLASKEGGEIWAKLPGYLSPNRNVSPDNYPNELTKQLAQTIISAGESVRYDMSDLAPSAFGGTDGKGEWKHLQDFLRDPSDVKGTQEKLEADAAKAWKK
ncbi:sugar ABC transporter substrate-binding protein [Thermobispora bispora]|jgi:alpha-glucoside transport system substrate-binding protein|uniref:Extracellular solute-binding protein family 1 n=1 Tax=Thermobispora bispora (strain ATCC 19993 / DSM 43833 / CBS 139.67 / JCM 10125 / KCTC 9307 / NBRC 14880 / R51) TaxID=469371 RepID=D6Y6M1_THEBD|nr:ABC transporter substrate-binding protein [Thermobispora bispora]MBO2472930.1 carbohydrate ABC transporter substrate-binding protein [Actinomycetales bacterium]MDI9582280.1 ABC transporter substrate-binding protein [Thermobispora sp.]ADG87593.1 extracellular solute-binding protein family 1 [Thermobispora bispora DSM 43833]MBX6168921.1 carbohydrate ABC transporter substrate-binding protein [Thermobispora bispora]QSI47515.1 carbohydrate ABC transporter substrate-binding protein [Thermobispora